MQFEWICAPLQHEPIPNAVRSLAEAIGERWPQSCALLSSARACVLASRLVTRPPRHRPRVDAESTSELRFFQSLRALRLWKWRSKSVQKQDWCYLGRFLRSVQSRPRRRPRSWSNKICIMPFIVDRGVGRVAADSVPTFTRTLQSFDVYCCSCTTCVQVLLCFVPDYLFVVLCVVQYVHCTVLHLTPLA